MTLPNDVDPECEALCAALNQYPGVRTTESCCGHGEDPFGVWFILDHPVVLPAVVHWFGHRACGVWGWSVEVQAHSVMGPLIFRIRGPVGDYAGANMIAQILKEALGEEQNEIS